MYKVMLACESHCENWEDVRETLRTDDPVEAIRKSEMHRDQDHISWVEEVKPEVVVDRQYHMTASRGSSGIEGDYDSVRDVLARLDAYDRSFPGELTEIHIHKLV